MIVTFISQCEKKALNRTRRVLDAFANRIGDNTWQTVITEDGLMAVKKLIRMSATKSTAVSCHWIRSRRRSDLMWIVGNRNKFNNQGIVPVNRTQKDVFTDVVTMKAQKDEVYANTHLQPLAIHSFAVGYVAKKIFENNIKNEEFKNLANITFLAGCLHDLGKLDPLFQEWVRNGKKRDLQDDGQHIDIKFTFDKHPRHNEVSLFLFNLFEIQSNRLNTANKEHLQHAIYWHHAKPYRRDDNFNGVYNTYEYLLKNINIEQMENICNKALALLKHINVIAQHYDNSLNQIEQYLTWQLESFSSLIDDFRCRFKNAGYPEFKDYSVADDFEGLTTKITYNAKNNMLRACVISADRLISSLSVADLSDYVQQQRLDELIDFQQDGSNLVPHLENALMKFPNSDRSLKQSEVAYALANIRDIAVLSGAAGCGKTKIALEWVKIKNAQKIIWVCPRVQICQGIFQELTEYYLPDAKVEIFTGEFKYTNSWEKETHEKDYFSGDVVVTTIDQLLGSIVTHTNVNSLLPFMDSYVIFDEYHEYIGMEIFNILFAELIASKQMRQLSDKRILLVSATPHYLYLDKILRIHQDDVVEMSSFNKSQYRIEFADYDETNKLTSPFYQTYQQNTFVISNTAKTAQLSFLYQQKNENSVLFHAKYKKSDKKFWFNEVYESFKKDGTHKYNTLRAGPIIQASLNISCDYMISEMSNPENVLQRLGRLDRFGKNGEINTLKLVISDDIKRGKQIGASAKFLASLYSLQSAKAWYEYLTEHLLGKTFELPKIYAVYKSFYNEGNSQIHNLLMQDIQAAIRKSVILFKDKIVEPTKIIKLKPEVRKSKISTNSLRGDSRFVQLAILDVNEYSNPIFRNQYAYQPPLNDSDEYDNLTESLSFIRDLGLLTFIAQKHGNIDPSHPVKGIPDKKQTLRCKVLENCSRDADYPLYLSYIEDDLNKVGGTGLRHEEAIYYAICDKQPIGAISLKTVQNLIINNNGE